MSGRKPQSKNQIFKRKKLQNARNIRAEALDASGNAPTELSEGGAMLKVPEFMASREYEVKQLQSAIHNSKSASSTRVFQSLPRKLRRRTASHNVKRIPKRMRNRALREMKKSDQVVTKGTKDGASRYKRGLTAKQLYKARMAVKLLRLAAKSQSMKLALPPQVTASNCKLRARIKALQSTLKENRKGHRASERNNPMGSYDNTGINELASKSIGRVKYMKRQKDFTWLPTHVWNAKRSHMCKRWGYQIPWSPTQKCFKLTHRIGGYSAASDGSMCCDTSYIGTMILFSPDAGFLKSVIAQLTCNRASLSKYRNSQYWFEGLVYDTEGTPLGPIDLLWASVEKVIVRLHPAIYDQVFEQLSVHDPNKLVIQDCRFSIGSITLFGAKSLNALSQVLRGCHHSESYNQFRNMSYVSDTSSLPQRANFAFHAMDPRHLSNPRKLKCAKPNVDTMLELQNNYPQDEILEVLNKLTEPEGREKSYRNQQTLKQLAMRRHKLLGDLRRKNLIPFKADVDSEIPLLICKKPRENSWVVMLPWFWLLPLWYQLNRVTRVYHMGMRQIQQLTYEKHLLYFPDDYPFTRVGLDENSTYKKLSHKAVWERKPAGKRVNFGKIPNVHIEQPVAFPGEIGDPFSCDWKLLQVLRNGLEFLKSQGIEDIEMFDVNRTTQFDENSVRKLQYLNDIIELYQDVRQNGSVCTHLPITVITKRLESWSKEPLDFGQVPQTAVVTSSVPVIAIDCEFEERGHPKDNARIYSIPEKDRKYWDSIASVLSRPNGKRNHDTAQPVPGIENLIGFVTSGTFHLGNGKGSCTGFIDAKEAILYDSEYVLIRNVGTNVYRLAKWRQILL